MTDATPHDTHYLLGHTTNELERLDAQGLLYRPATLRAFVEAGLEPGMRVLDIGCGTGDVSLLASELVGSDGWVLGIDRGESAIEAARARAAARPADNVEFRVSEIDDFTTSDSFDALVGRFVLMHQSDPAATLRRGAEALSSGGLVCIVESYMDVLLTGAHSFPHSSIYDGIVRWKSDVVDGAGADLHAGGRLRSTFVEAGLPAPTTRMDARLEGGPDSPYYDYLVRSLESMMPEAARQGLRDLDPPDPELLVSRLRDEVVASEGVLVAWPVVSAWCKVG